MPVRPHRTECHSSCSLTPVAGISCKATLQIRANPVWLTAIMLSNCGALLSFAPHELPISGYLRFISLPYYLLLDARDTVLTSQTRGPMRLMPMAFRGTGAWRNRSV